MAKFKFKVGDKVVIKDDLNFHNFENGEVVVIKEVDRYGGYTGYRVGDAPENWMCFDDREIEEYKEEVKVQKFKVGDKVRLVKKYLYSFEKIGMVGEVVKDSGYSTLSITIKDSGDPEFWWTYPAHDGNWELVEEEKEMPKCKFKVGDLVKGNDSDRYFVTNDRMTKAEVISVQKHDYIRVKILEHLEGLEGLPVSEFDVDPQYFDFYEEPKLVQNEKPKTTVLKLGEYKIIFNGDTTVVTDGTRKGVAKRHPDDEYDAIVGLQVALERFHGGRKPKIGDKVRVLKVDGNSKYSDHHWEVGDVAEVFDFAYGGEETDIRCCKEGTRWAYQTLIAGEYEVLG